ncbi:MAG: DUF5060 domain-containing protein, partial [Bacteroidota bacterium]
MKYHLFYNLSLLILIYLTACQKQENKQVAAQWNEVELVFQSEDQYNNPYTDVEFWIEFTHESGKKLVRPGFWNGNNNWKVRFASPYDTGEWQWQSFASNAADEGLHGQTGK